MEDDKPRRGNQGWSTAGRAGRKPLPPGEKRKNRSLKATDAEWEKILAFSRKLKRGEVKMASYIKNGFGTEINYEAAVNLMDDEIREDLHCKMAPCTDQEFFDAYEKAHEEKFGEVWECSKENPYM